MEQVTKLNRIEKNMFKKITGDWGRLANGLPDLMRVDLHFGRGEPGQFRNNMAEVHDIVVNALREAQATGRQYVLFVHGSSTSRPGKTTARSIVRATMRSKESTPFIIKNKSLQHNSVFVAAIKRCTGIKVAQVTRERNKQERPNGCSVPGCGIPAKPDSSQAAYYEGQRLCSEHYTAAIWRDLWCYYAEWEGDSLPPARFTYLLGRISGEENWQTVGDSYLSAARIRERGFNFRKMTDGCEFEITRHPGAWGGPVPKGTARRVVQKWSADLNKKTLTLMGTRRFRKGDFDL
jgi:hypothetical protein